MKAWTKKFLEAGPEGPETRRAMLSNAQKAEKRIKFPAALWEELAEKAELPTVAYQPAKTAFAMGLAIGWAEHEESVK